jgi:hypothetical protein
MAIKVPQKIEMQLKIQRHVNKDIGLVRQLQVENAFYPYW